MALSFAPVVLLDEHEGRGSAQLASWSATGCEAACKLWLRTGGEKMHAYDTAPVGKVWMPALALCVALAWALCTGCAASPTGDSAGSEGPGSARPEDNASLMLPANTYDPAGSVEVDGRQGVCCEGDHYWVSGSTTLTKYDRDWNVVAQNTKPFDGYEVEVNHIGDIDVWQNELYVSAEYFMDGVGKNIQIAVYDGDTLQLKRTFPFEPASGQLECSGIAVDPEAQAVWMCSWVGEESGRYLYRYNLGTGAYEGRVHLQMPPQWLQGVACYDGCLYMTADDGTADDGEPDHLYRAEVKPGATSCTVTLERTFDDVTRQGEIEGLTFDKSTGRLLLLYNRGARIVLGMPKGFYEGYDREISEVFSFDVAKR